MKEPIRMQNENKSKQSDKRHSLAWVYMLSHFKFEFVWILISRRVELKIDFYDIIFLYLKTLIFKFKTTTFQHGKT